MRVMVIGGAGVFGSRLAELLARDGHAVTIAGRDPVRAYRAADRIAAATGRPVRAVPFDLRGDLSPIDGQEVVIDAAGPFQSYRSDRYRLPRAAIAAGVHYLDLSDDPEFTAGIGALDAAAVAAGVFVLSGASSVPALSSAAAVALMEGLDEVAQIDSAILPGNRAPRGRSVIDSILGQIGRPLALTLDGQRIDVRSWSVPRRYALGAGMHRTGHLIGVPDVRLFPEALSVPTVLFRAGLELWPMRAGLALWSATGRAMPGLMRRLAHLAARGLYPFGSDRGGMVVELTGRTGGASQRRRWILRVTRGQGPYIPGIAVRTLLRRPAAISPGARPAVAAFALAEAEAAMADLATTTERRSDPAEPLFPRVLGQSFDLLPEAVRATHDSPAVRVLTGTAEVIRGAGLFPRLIAAVFRFPPAAPSVPVTVIKWPDAGQGETWERRFGDRRFLSHLAPERGRMTERFGPITFTLDLHVRDGALHFPVAGARLGPVPIPRFLWPDSRATETAATGGFEFDVALHAPLTGDLIVRYRGSLARHRRT